MVLLWQRAKSTSIGGRRSTTCRQYWRCTARPPHPKASAVVLSSKYLSAWLRTSSCSASIDARRSASAVNNGSQWSENGPETSRAPVSQLRIDETTMAFDRGAPGGDVV